MHYFLSLEIYYHFTTNAIIKTKRTRQDIGTNWNAKPICDVRFLQPGLDLIC